MEIVVYKEHYTHNETIIFDKILSKEEIRKILDEKYGEKGWWSYDILV